MRSHINDVLALCDSVFGPETNASLPTPGEMFGGPVPAVIAPDEDGRDHINGCPVIHRVAGACIIDHPAGYMVYRSWRVGIRKTLKGAISLAERTA